ncbi:15127_t:CDS:1, partial [Dentiscutata heterogama]
WASQFTPNNYPNDVIPPKQQQQSKGAQYCLWLTGFVISVIGKSYQKGIYAAEK